MEERARLRAVQEAEADRQRARLRDEREAHDLGMTAAQGSGPGGGGGPSGAGMPPPPGAAGGGGLGGGAPGGGRGRGLSNLPAWMVEQKQAQQAALQQADAMPQGRGAVEAAPQPGQFEDAGGGRAGPAGAPAALPPPPPKKRSLFRNPTRVLLLKNMVGAGEVDEELKGDVAEECGKFGPVREVRVLELPLAGGPGDGGGGEGGGGGASDDEAVRCFVCFERQESAIKAFMGMEGRFFAGRTVRCSFFSEASFEANDLSPKDDEAQ